MRNKMPVPFNTQINNCNKLSILKSIKNTLRITLTLLIFLTKITRSKFNLKIVR